MKKPWEYLEDEPKKDAPISDNESGLYCSVCRSVRMYHCSSPEYCGNMERMKPKPNLEDK